MSRRLVHEDEWLLIGCDGIWETMSVSEIVTFIQKHKDMGLKYTNEELLDMAMADDASYGCGCDNMSSILVDLKKISKNY